MITNERKKMIMSKNAKRHALENYGLKKHMDNFIKICQNIKKL